MQFIHMQLPRRSLRVDKNITVSIKVLAIITSVIISVIALSILIIEVVKTFSSPLKTFELSKMLNENKIHTYYQDQDNLAKECMEYLRTESDRHSITSTECIEILRGTVSERTGS
jgi:hypothetical protein